ncbi:MAG: ABC transporter permease [Gemmatimonadaceae bacterium]
MSRWRGTAWPFVVVLALLLIAAVAPLLAPYAPDAVDLAARRQPPSLHHWFGTDELGRDVLTRVWYGARVSLAVGVLSALLASALGALVGGAGGYRGGWLDAALMRLTDALLAVPRLPLLMIAASILQPSIPVLIVLVGVVGWMETARVVRADVLSLAQRPFVEAARATGAPDLRIVPLHILPNAAPAMAVSTTLAVGRSILLESALSFFGVGVQPPAASWGNMLYQAQTTMTTAPWLALFPGLMIFLAVFAINGVGERLAHRSRGA